MAAYSLDLRKRIVDAVERGIATKREIARIFGVHETFVHKLLPLMKNAFSKIKTTSRSLKARTKRKLNNALAKAIKMISVDDICGWFAHCGYVFSFI
jgi:transposase